MKTKPIVQWIEKPVSGEWGVEPSNGHSIGVIRNANFTNEGVMDLSDIAYRDIPAKKIKQKALKFGDIIIEKSGGSPTQPVGRVIYYDRPDGEFMFSNFTAALRPVAGVDSRFVYYMLWATHLFKKTSAYQNKTTGIANLQLERYINEVEIPCPPLPTQRRIAAVLDKAQALVANDRRTLAVYDKLAKSLFLEMFGDPVRNERGWEKKRLDRIGETVTGNTPPRDTPSYYGDHIEWIKTDNINTPGTYLTKATEFLSKSGAERGRVVAVGSLLVTCIAGSKHVIGNAAIADRAVAFNQQINALVPKADDALFLYYQFALSKDYVQSFSTDGMKGMISKSKFNSIEFIVPPHAVQAKFKRAILKLDAQRANAEASHRRSEGLFGSLLQRAFAGDL